MKFGKREKNDELISEMLEISPGYRVEAEILLGGSRSNDKELTFEQQKTHVRIGICGSDRGEDHTEELRFGDVHGFSHTGGENWRLQISIDGYRHDSGGRARRRPVIVSTNTNLMEIKNAEKMYMA